ncbi:MAG TPA: acyltransferase family protein [Methylomirabilota bacterium]|nr:acyltransferase family protein [Methylomirabilota bacterium]
MAAAVSRYHSLDALRGTMMLLGIYLHAAVAYSRHGSWPWKDGSTTGMFDLSLGLIHVFRMPVFYVMAGFFAALLLERRGIAGFIRNRTIRILVPFLAGWTGLFLLVRALVIVAMNLEEPASIPVKYLEFFTSGEVLRHLDPMHLWFLEYLLVFYAIALAALPLARGLSALTGALNRAFRAALTTPLGPLVLAAITFPTLCLMQEGAVDDPSSFIPEPRIVITYFVFFGAGWLLSRNADLLEALRILPRPLLLLGLGLAAAALGGYAMWRQWEASGTQALAWFLGSTWFLSLAMWLFVLGFIGTFLRFLERPLPWVRYLSDSSYWLYLAHMPVLLALQLVAAGMGWTPATKALGVLGASIPILLASYHLLVRHTWVGMILNGRRYRRSRGLVPGLTVELGKEMQ